jgi:hypothetical protein
VQHEKIIFNRVFIKENATSFLRKSSSPFFLQELRPLTPLKTTVGNNPPIASSGETASSFQVFPKGIVVRTSWCTLGAEP